MEQKQLFIISGAIVLIIILAAWLHVLFKTSVEVKAWRNGFGQLHREDDRPASICYHKDGEIEVAAWYLNGKFIRSETP